MCVTPDIVPQISIQKWLLTSVKGLVVRSAMWPSIAHKNVEILTGNSISST